MSLNKMNIEKLQNEIKSGNCSAEAIVKSMYKCTEQSRKNNGTYISLMKDSALEDAKQIDKEIQSENDINTLSGIPIGIQDNLCLDGELTTCASKMLHNFVPSYTATAVNKIRQNGGIIIGKTNMDEFGIGSTGETSYFNITTNPYNNDYVAGGSASGSAAGVASGEMCCALGTSVMKPSSFCGVVGFKPSYGSVSRYGAVLSAPSMEQVGIVGKTVEDVAKIFSVISGIDDKDPKSVDFKYTLDEMKDFNPDKLRIGVTNSESLSMVNGEVKRSVDSAVDKLSKSVIDTIKISLLEHERVLSAYGILSAAEIASGMYKYDGISFGYRTTSFNNVDELYEKNRGEGFGYLVKERIMLGMYVLGSDKIDTMYNKARSVRQMVINRCNEIFENVEIIITPTTISTAPKIGELSGDTDKMYYMDTFTAIAELAGLPSITVPCGKDENGLPIGMQIIGKKFDDGLVLNIANYYEKLVDGFSHPINI